MYDFRVVVASRLRVFRVSIYFIAFRSVLIRYLNSFSAQTMNPGCLLWLGFVQLFVEPRVTLAASVITTTTLIFGQTIETKYILKLISKRMCGAVSTTLNESLPATRQISP